MNRSPVSPALWVLAVVSVAVASQSAAGARPTEGEKARKAAEKKLDAFEKNYDPSKDLSRKNPEKLDRDIAELDAALEALKAVDAAAAGELSPRRDALVAKTKEGVGAAVAGKADDVFNKHLSKLQDQFDPGKRRLESVEPSNLKSAKDELDRDIEKFEPSARKPYEDQRDAFLAKVKGDIAQAKVGKLRSEVREQVPALEPVAGVDTIAPANPTWCDGVAKALESTYQNYHVASLEGWDTAGAQQLAQVVMFSCLDPEFDGRKKWVAWYRQGLANRYGMNAAATEKLLRLGARLAIAGSDEVDKQKKDVCAKFSVLPTGTTEVRYSRKLERQALGCSDTVIKDGYVHQPAADETLVMNAADVPNGLASQLAGAELARLMTSQGFHSNDGKLTGFAVANAVIPLDVALFEKELAASGLNEVGVILATQAFYGMKQKMKLLEAEARARNAAVLLEAPKKGVAAFLASLSDRQSAINVALALEEAKRAGKLKGCASKLYPDLVAAVKGQKGNLDALTLDGLLAYKLTLCGRGDSDAPVMEYVFGYYAQHSVPVRGPFTAAYMALLDAHNASSDKGGARGGFDPTARRGEAPSEHKGPFVPDSNPIEPAELEHNNTMNPNRADGGVVKAVEKKGELTTITFRTEHFMVPVLECHETNKIDRIASDGTILYRSSCKQVGEKPAESTNAPITVPTFAANGVSPGSFLYYASATVNDDVKGQPHRGWVIEAYESKARKTRTSLFGIAQ